MHVQFCACYLIVNGNDTLHHVTQYWFHPGENCLLDGEGIIPARQWVIKDISGGCVTKCRYECDVTGGLTTYAQYM